MLPVFRIAKAFAHHKLHGTPRFISIEVTYKCNAKCQTCEYYTYKDYKQLKDYVPVVRTIDPLSVDFTGGEPLVRRDFVDIVQNISTECPNVALLSMNTNAGLLTPDKAAELKKAGMGAITISLDYIGGKHDKNRAIKGLYQHIVQLIPELKKIRFARLQLHTILSKDNIDHIIPITELARDLGVYSSFVTFTNKKVGNRYFQPESEEEIGRIEDVCRQLISLKKKYRNITNTEYYLQQIPEFFRKGSLPGCTAGMNWFTIAPDGTVKPCAELPPICDYKEFTKEKRLLIQNCGDCWVKCRGSNQYKIKLRA